MKIVAIAEDDAQAFVSDENVLFLLQPPNIIEGVPEKDLDRAVCLHGFQGCSIEVKNMREAVEIVKKKYVEYMVKHGVKLPTHEELKGLLDYADESVLLSMLIKAEKKNNPKGSLELASDILQVAEKKGYNSVCDKANKIINKRR